MTTGTIPQVIHQTWSTKTVGDMPRDMRVWLESWRSQSPQWQHILWDDADCLAFMARYFPRLLDIYQALPSGAERADLFRYAVIYQCGGMYTDIDTTCMVSVAQWPWHGCDFLLGVEGVLHSESMRLHWGFARQVQLTQWTFAARPKHPILGALLYRIETVVRAALAKGELLPRADDIFNRTGPGIWTDVILDHLRLPPSCLDWGAILRDPFNQRGVRILPLRAFGWVPNSINLPWRTPHWDTILVRHRFLGSWRPTPQSG